MTLLGKSKNSDSVTLAKWEILFMNLDDINKNLHEQNVLFNDLLREIKSMVVANKEFVNVIQNFFAIEKKLRIEDAMRREKKEQDFDISPGDLKY